MNISFVAGFGPIVTDMDRSYGFYRGALGIEFEGDPGYWHTDALAGVNAFALWPLSAAAESCFGVRDWPRDVPVPQAWLEFDVESPASVGAAAEELERGGYRLLAPAREEPWGQTVARLLSPEGLLLGIAFTPWMHKGDATSAPAGVQAPSSASPGAGGSESGEP
jgi:catechol 2,3-dioxygenase-like lactoylglutathione lyase family enzyme